jgi:hypothetical protein
METEREITVEAIKEVITQITSVDVETDTYHHDSIKSFIEFYKSSSWSATGVKGWSEIEMWSSALLSICDISKPWDILLFCEKHPESIRIIKYAKKIVKEYLA